MQSELLSITQIQRIRQIFRSIDERHAGPISHIRLFVCNRPA